MPHLSNSNFGQIDNQDQPHAIIPIHHAHVEEPIQDVSGTQGVTLTPLDHKRIEDIKKFIAENPDEKLNTSSPALRSELVEQQVGLKQVYEQGKKMNIGYTRGAVRRDKNGTYIVQENPKDGVVEYKILDPTKLLSLLTQQRLSESTSGKETLGSISAVHARSGEAAYLKSVKRNLDVSQSDTHAIFDHTRQCFSVLDKNGVFEIIPVSLVSQHSQHYPLSSIESIQALPGAKKGNHVFYFNVTLRDGGETQSRVLDYSGEVKYIEEAGGGKKILTSLDYQNHEHYLVDTKNKKLPVFQVTLGNKSKTWKAIAVRNDDASLKFFPLDSSIISDFASKSKMRGLSQNNTCIERIENRGNILAMQLKEKGNERSYGLFYLANRQGDALYEKGGRGAPLSMMMMRGIRTSSLLSRRSLAIDGGTVAVDDVHPRTTHVRVNHDNEVWRTDERLLPKILFSPLRIMEIIQKKNI